MKGLWCIAFLITLVSCTQGIKKATPVLLLEIPSEETGITFSNNLVKSDSLNILDYLYFYNGGGTAVGDINNDGLPDIYLSGNQVKNKLYLNKGNLKFEDITVKAGVEGASSWNTGTMMFDANEDGLLDIYVCAVVGINGFQGHNELFINNGDNTFTESAGAYGLDFKTYSTMAAPLDYDKDGDLDLYLLNHAVHTENSYGKADLRLKRNEPTSDKLLRNDNGVFKEVSEEMGLIGGITSYGLGVSIADFNQDGWPDIFVGNDFHEDDYYYINEEGKRFRESLKENFGHTSRFSMGNDVADINRDGYPDLISLDMTPEDEKVLKSSQGDDNLQIQKLRVEQFGYHYQFTRNMLFINQPGYQFREQALYSGIASTDWSWSALFADFDNDSYQDLFISNGIPKRPNDLDFINFISSDEIKNSLDNTRLVDAKALSKMPSGKVSNYVYQGTKDYSFKNRTSDWINHRPSVSGATALIDLDNDGDLDLIVNNSDENTTVYENQTNQKKQWLKLKFDYTDKNKWGIGTKAYLYTENGLQYKELYTTRGFQASSEPTIHFGLGEIKRVDSLKIIWPNNTFQILTNIKSNQTLHPKPENTKPFTYPEGQKGDKIFSKVDDNLGITFKHEEDPYLDFNRQKLIPFRVSDRGPGTAVGDLNGDGLDDIFFGSSKFKSSEIFIQREGAFEKAYENELKPFAKTEDVTARIVADTTISKIYVGTGGAVFSITNEALTDFCITFKNGELSHSNLSSQLGNTSVIVESDYDQDGDLDIFVGRHTITGDYGTPPVSYLLKNNNGTFSIDFQNELGAIGMVTDAVWSDFNGDNIDDLIVIGEWMAPHYYENVRGVLKRTQVKTEPLKGLWQSIEPFDIDGDGDLDYLLGNWGTNSKFTASVERPLKMYQADFDKNGQSETIVATHRQGKYYPILGLKDLSEQLVSLKKKYTTNTSFAGQSVAELFGKYALENANLLEVHILKSGYLKNDSGIFTFVPFKGTMQVAPIMDFLTADFDQDGKKEVLAGGNYFGVKPYHGRLDSFSGALIKSENDILAGYEIGLDFAQKSVRHLSIIQVANNSYLLATYNDDAAQLYRIN